MLHPGKKESSAEHGRKDTDTRNNDIENVYTHFIKQPGQVLLATAFVDISEGKGKTHIYRALLVQGSQASFVTEDLVKSAGLKRAKISGEVTGLSEGSKLRTKYVVEFKIRSRINPHFTLPVKAYVLNSITDYLPSQECTVTSWPGLKQSALADPTFYKPNNIDILLGAEIYAQILDNGLLKSSAGMIAQKTKLGWIISGTAHSIFCSLNPVVNLHVCNSYYTQPHSGKPCTITPWWAVKNKVLGGRNVCAVSAAP